MSKINIILYPRSYNKRGGESLHSVQGVTEDGRSVNIKLRLHESQKNNPHAPSIAEFSREDIGASNPCQANINNGPDNKHGILLFTDCIRSQSKGIETYEAKWGTVLANTSNSPAPLVGIGRMVVNKSTPFINTAKRKLQKAIADQDRDEIEKLNKDINNPSKYSYPVIMYYPEDIQEVVSTDIDNFKMISQEYLSKYSYDGHASGIMIRLVNLKGRIIDNSYTEVISRYIAAEGRNQNPLETIEYFIENIEPKMAINYFANPSLKLQIIPLLRVTSAVYSIKYYSKENQLSFTKSHYYKGETEDTDELEPCVCNVATRVSYNGDFDKMLLSRVYALTSPLGHPARMDSKGRMSMLFENEDAKLAQRDVSQEEIKKSDIGLSFESLPTRAIWIIKGDQAPIIKETKNEDKDSEKIKLVVQPKEEESLKEETKEVVNDTIDDSHSEKILEMLNDVNDVDGQSLEEDIQETETINESEENESNIEISDNNELEHVNLDTSPKENENESYNKDDSEESLEIAPDFDDVFNLDDNEHDDNNEIKDSNNSSNKAQSQEDNVKNNDEISHDTQNETEDLSEITSHKKEEVIHENVSTTTKQEDKKLTGLAAFMNKKK